MVENNVGATVPENSGETNGSDDSGSQEQVKDWKREYDVIKAQYTNLESKLGEQGNELGRWRKVVGNTDPELLAKAVMQISNRDEENEEELEEIASDPKKLKNYIQSRVRDEIEKNKRIDLIREADLTSLRGKKHFAKLESDIRRVIADNPTVSPETAYLFVLGKAISDGNIVENESPTQQVIKPSTSERPSAPTTQVKPDRPLNNDELVRKYEKETGRKFHTGASVRW